MSAMRIFLKCGERAMEIRIGYETEEEDNTLK